jgi:outer membrane receptor protein involved in Fe transport
MQPLQEEDIQMEQNQFYEERRQLVYQFGSEHYFPGTGLKIELDASFTDGTSELPDFKRISYYYNPENNIYYFANDVSVSRDFRYLFQDIFDSRIHAEIPLTKKAGLQRKLKFGGAYQYNNRSFEQYKYESSPTDGDTIPDGDLNKYYTAEAFQYREGEIPQGYGSKTSIFDFSYGYSNISSAYLMIDYDITRWLRIAGGLRMEHTDIYSDLEAFRGLAVDDSVREDISLHTFKVSAYPTQIDTFHFLPSVNLIIKLIDNSKALFNIRLNYSKSLARPSIRELTLNFVYDYEYNFSLLGNPSLKMVDISNYDFRLESFFSSGEFISFSLFYKYFLNHIELLRDQRQFYTWFNAEESEIYGVELEGKKKFLKNFEFMANVTLVNSKSRSPISNIHGSEESTEERAMFGQAPWIVNGLLAYSSEKLGLSAALSYNRQGKKLTGVGVKGASFALYEMPRHMVDFKVGKTIGRFGIELKIRNLLNEPVTRESVEEDGSKRLYDEYHWGTSYTLGISYDL